MSYKKSSAYIGIVPSEIKFSLSYNDGSGEWLSVNATGKFTDVLIKQGDDNVLIPADRIGWLRQTLKDIQDIIELKQANETTTNTGTNS